MNLISPYYCIATSGETRDGRIIKPEWLQSMASTYDPSESEALLWYDHSRWRDPAGAVVSLKTETDDKGRVRLFASIRPTSRLIAEAAQVEIPFKFSIEVTKRGAEDEYYLDGLAYTHDPASVAVDSLEFSKENPKVDVIPGETLATLEFKKQSLFGNLFGQIETVQPEASGNPTQDDEEMTPEQFAALKTLIEEGQKVQAAELAAFKKDVLEVKTEISTFKEKIGDVDFKAFSAKVDGIEERFTQQGEIVNKTWEEVEKIGNSSAGRFKKLPDDVEEGVELAKY